MNKQSHQYKALITNLIQNEDRQN